MPAHAIVLSDKPAKVSGSSGDESPSQLFSSHVRPLIEGAQREVILISPYFIPTEQGLGILSALARRGVRVRILTNSLASTDYWPLAFAGYARLRARLLQAGLELHEMRPEPVDGVRSRRPGTSSGAYLHTKAIVVDRERVIVGSMNLDPRSRLLNTEVALLMESPELGARLGTLFEEAVQPAHAFNVVLAGARSEQTELVWITEGAGNTRTEKFPVRRG